MPSVPVFVISFFNFPEFECRASSGSTKIENILKKRIFRPTRGKVKWGRKTFIMRRVVIRILQLGLVRWATHSDVTLSHFVRENRN